MSVGRITTGTINGIDGERVTVEVDASPGIPAFDIVGLPDTTVKEAKERVRAAIKNSGFGFPLKKIIINLAPADVRKAGSGFDLPMAVGVLQGAEYFIESPLLTDGCFVGELSLDGSVRAVRGVLAIALMARNQGINHLVVPTDNMAEASLVEGINIYGLANLSQLPQLLDDAQAFRSPYRADHLIAAVSSRQENAHIDFCDVKGQTQAKRALEIAAAGGHNIALFGPPGSGKSMLAKAFTGILPPMDFDEMLDVSRIYSVSGLLNKDQVLITHRPFRAPHHSASQVGITGGGSYPKPGEITLSHHGVLFLDEFTEFPRPVLEVLRQPLEDGIVTVSRAQQTVTFPAAFILLAAMNPCPCGFLGDTARRCTCAPQQVQRYLGKLSGPLMDRIDLQLEVPRLTETELMDRHSETQPQREDSATVRARVTAARERQRARYIDSPVRTNSRMTSDHLKRYCRLEADGEAMMAAAVRRFNLSGRAFDRILKLSRTIADLESVDAVAGHHVAEALRYRGQDKLTAAQQAAPVSVPLPV